MDADSDDEFTPELIERLKSRIPDFDWQRTQCPCEDGNPASFTNTSITTTFGKN
jgi:hypothetical protein